jgi:hypothetical protein
MYHWYCGNYGVMDGLDSFRFQLLCNLHVTVRINLRDIPWSKIEISSTRVCKYPEKGRQAHQHGQK